MYSMYQQDQIYSTDSLDTYSNSASSDSYPNYNNYTSNYESNYQNYQSNYYNYQNNYNNGNNSSFHEYYNANVYPSQYNNTYHLTNSPTNFVNRTTEIYTSTPTQLDIRQSLTQNYHNYSNNSINYEIINYEPISSQVINSSNKVQPRIINKIKIKTPDSSGEIVLNKDIEPLVSNSSHRKRAVHIERLDVSSVSIK